MTASPTQTETAASRTAIGAALMRGLHTRTHPRPLFDDPWGERLIPASLKAQLHQAALARLDPALRARAQAAAPGALLDHSLRANPAFAGVVLRSRHAEEALAAAIRRGVRQYVLIGAGLDSFAVRNTALGHPVSVFELDLPATQTLKRQWIAAEALPLASPVHFVPTDLSRETVAAALSRSAFDPSRPAFFSWLGVTMYLPRAANVATLASIASFAAAGSEIVFEYVDQRELDAGTDAFDGLRAMTAAVGEPLRSGFDPETLAVDLLRLGLDVVDDLDGRALALRYPDHGTDPLRPPPTQHLALARVRAQTSVG